MSTENTLKQLKKELQTTVEVFVCDGQYFNQPHPWMDADKIMAILDKYISEAES
jgi:hypothetical protein